MLEEIDKYVAIILNFVKEQNYTCLCHLLFIFRALDNMLIPLSKQTSLTTVS